jgi:hypothetical protein
MKARVVITAGGQVSVFVDEGTLETGREAIERFFARLAAQDVAVAWDGRVEQHRHEREAATSHVHAHEGAHTQ